MSMRDPLQGQPAPRRMELMGYTKAQQRTDNCRHCKAATMQVRDPDTPYEREVLSCSVGEFPVSHSAICEHWERAK